MLYRVTVRSRMSDGARLTASLGIESSSPGGAMAIFFRHWNPPYMEYVGTIYGITVTEMRIRGKRKSAEMGTA